MVIHPFGLPQGVRAPRLWCPALCGTGERSPKARLGGSAIPPTYGPRMGVAEYPLYIQNQHLTEYTCMSFLREAYVIIILLPVLKCSVKILCKSLSENTVAKMQKILACVCRLLIILLCFCQLRPHQKGSSRACERSRA